MLLQVWLVRAAWLGLALPLALLGCSGGSGPGAADASDGSREDGADGGDPGADRGEEGDGGADPGDSEAPWPGCPTAEGYRGGGWSAEVPLVATPEATYCFTFDSSIPVEDQLGLKTMIRLAPGTYGLPAESGEFELVLPFCVLFGPGAERLEPAGIGSVQQDIRGTWFLMQIYQPMRTTAGDPWVVRMSLDGTLEGPLVLDNRSLFWGRAWLGLVQGDHDPLLRYQSCDYRWVEPNRLRVQFEGGEVTLTVHLPQIDATVFGLFSDARGTLDGVPFEQQSYWKLAFYSWLHFYFCDFLVLFDEPIGQACGLRIDELLVWDDADNPQRKLELVDCQFSPLGERAIRSVVRLP